MPEEKKVRGNKKKQQKKKDLRKLKILHACAPLGRAYNRVEDQEDARRYVKRAKEGYEQQLGRDSKKALDLTRTLIAIIGMSLDDCIAKSRYLVKRSVGALGEENVVTLSALSELGVDLHYNEEYEEASKVCKKRLAGRMEVLGDDHRDTSATVLNMGSSYKELGINEKALEYFERDLEWSKKYSGEYNPDTLNTVNCMGELYRDGLKDLEKAEELLRIALEGLEAQLGKDHHETEIVCKELVICLRMGRKVGDLAALVHAFSWLEKLDDAGLRRLYTPISVYLK